MRILLCEMAQSRAPPLFHDTYQSELKLTTLPESVKAATKGPRGMEMVDIAVKDSNGKLLSDAIPVVTISADGGYSGMDYGHDTAPEIDLIASIEHKLKLGLLTGFVIQGLVPYGRTPSHTRSKLLHRPRSAAFPLPRRGAAPRWALLTQRPSTSPPAISPRSRRGSC